MEKHPKSNKLMICKNGSQIKSNDFLMVDIGKLSSPGALTSLKFLQLQRPRLLLRDQNLKDEIGVRYSLIHLMLGRISLLYFFVFSSASQWQIKAYLSSGA